MTSILRPILTIAQYDLIKALKARETFAFGLIMPGIMMLLLGIAMGGADTTPTIVIDVLDNDQSTLSAQFVNVLHTELEDNTRSFRLCDYLAETDACDLPSDLTPENWQSTADQRLKDTEAYGTIIIPAGFGDTLLAGDTVTVIYKNSADFSAPTLAEQKINAAISHMSGSITIAKIAVNTADKSFGAMTSDARIAAFESVRAQAESAWENRPIRVTTEATKKEITHLGFNQSGPGVALMFVFIFGMNAAVLLVSERDTGTLQRLYTLPVSRMVIIAGKLVGHLVYVLLIFLVLVLVGALFGVAWGNNVIGIALLMVVFSLMATALGMTLATIVRTSEQADNIATLLMMIAAPLGGAWWPLEIVPDFMKTIGHISPIAWGMDAFHEMMFYGGSVMDILPMLGVLLGMTVVFFAFGVWNFRYE
jgi:ABC-2 type transport system permease protein